MTIFAKQTCPHCGQSMKGTFAGVYFTPARFLILDCIRKNPGISRERIELKVYHRKVISHVVDTTITAINSLLASTNYRIKGPGQGHKDGGYTLVEEKEEQGRKKGRKSLSVCL
jgi:hypothetical protein